VTGLSSSQRTYLVMVNQALAAHPKWSYLDPAWIMTIMDIESGYDPVVTNSTGRQDGLMQVTPPTAQDMAAAYGIPAAPQTDPMVSILSGTAYLDTCARKIIAAWNWVSLPLWTVAKAYNGGFGHFLPGAVIPPAVAGRLATYLAKFEAELSIVEAQMAATASLMSKPLFAPRRMRSVMPLTVV
jgi:soluble lytic murein transglycosylase-like protein